VPYTKKQTHIQHQVKADNNLVFTELRTYLFVCLSANMADFFYIRVIVMPKIITTVWKHFAGWHTTSPFVTFDLRPTSQKFGSFNKLYPNIIVI